MTFGEFVKEKRQKVGITLRRFADILGIAPSYASDIEKSKRNAPTADILNKMIEVFELNEEEKSKMFDLAAQSKEAVAPDLKEYLCENDIVRVALRKAKNLNYGNSEWKKIIDEMNKK